jgi:hypothetical protein
VRDPGQTLPDHAAILATLSRSVPAGAGHATPGTVARVSGEARPGPGGLLTAPISGRPCVWFRTIVVRDESLVQRVALTQRPFVRPPTLTRVLASDMGYQGAGALDTESPALFAIGDATGEVLLDPRWADIDSAVVTVDDVIGDGFGEPWTVRREWILPPGAPVFACGAVSTEAGRPVLRATERDSLVASTRGEAMVVQRAQSVVAALPGATAGSGQRLLIGALVAGVAAVVVLVLLIIILLG